MRRHLLTAIAAIAVAASMTATCTAAALSAAVPTTEELTAQRRLNSLALHTHLLCSGVFVSGRDVEVIIAEDLQWPSFTFFDWRSVSVNVNRDDQRVTLSFIDDAPHPLFRRRSHTAVFHDGLGCISLPPGAARIAFNPPARTPPEGKTKNERQWSCELNRRSERYADASIREIEAILDDAFNDDSHDHPPQNTRAMVVVHRDRLLAERYAPGFHKDMPLLGWSMGKSLVPALVGVMARQGLLQPQDPAPIPEWRHTADPRSLITVDDLLRMSSGLRFRHMDDHHGFYYTDLHDHESVYFRAQNTAELVLRNPLQYLPGTVYQYRNTNPLALMYAMQRINENRQVEPLLWPYTALFDRIGIDSMVIEPDYFGNFLISGFVYATARDWARVGLLFLNDGVWRGQRLWPEGWSRYVTRPSATQPDYGAHVKLNTESAIPGVPTDAYWFNGWLRQTVLVIPSRDLIVVRLGYSETGGFHSWFGDLVSRIIGVLDSASISGLSSDSATRHYCFD